RAFIDGTDLHALTAAGAVLGNPALVAEVDKETRGIGKTVNFLTQYQGGPGTLRGKLAEGGTDVSLERASEILAGWRDTFPLVQHWIETTNRLVLAQGWTETPFGRKRFFTIHRRMW